MRQNLALCLALGLLQQASGAEALLYYCNNFLREAGMESTSSLALGMTKRRLFFLENCLCMQCEFHVKVILCYFCLSLGFVLVGMAKLLGNLPPMFFSDKHGRIPFMYISSIGMMLILFALVLITHFGTFGSVEVTLMCLFLFFFSIGIGTLLWVLIPELLPFRWRGRALGAVVFVNRVTSSAVTLSALNVIQAIQVSGFFTVYLFFSIASVMVSVLLLPETAGRSLEDQAKSKSHRGSATMLV